MYNLIPIYYGFGMSFIDIGMESLSKYYYISKHKNILIILGACALYAIQPLLFSNAMKYQGMGLMNVVWNVISTCVIILVGVFVFGEKFNKYQYAGIVLSIISLILLSIDIA